MMVKIGVLTAVTGDRHGFMAKTAQLRTQTKECVIQVKAMNNRVNFSLGKDVGVRL
ncbi:MAG: hypothetical protein RIG63_11325 [Coleofasciculus chthonoplastes F3-SA18-01]|jgi:hypothetical protein|uniref:hypothetical protein n=1 Tax=Coleofasciculus chthonoplastes TaxID=64178 RepID=UPI0032FEE7E9